MRIYHLSDEHWTAEPDFNTEAKRFFPWDGIEAQDWGGAWVRVLPGETLTPHQHDENEIFFVVGGSGLLKHGDEEHRVQYGSTMYMHPDTEHCLVNDGEDPLVFIAVWWDKPVRSVPVPQP
jgi:mannose-6-phosphate isomerase-like protein (cupin superfamily)